MKIVKIAFSTNMSAVSRLNGVFAKLRIWGVAGIKDYITKKVSWWRMANRFRSIAKRDSDAVPIRGITLIGDFMQGASNSKTNRDFAYALKEAEIPEFQRKILEIDPEAFIIFSESQQIVGNGFHIYR